LSAPREAVAWLARQVEHDRARASGTEQAAVPDALLAVIDAHHVIGPDETDEDYGEFGVSPAHPADHGCVTCHYQAMGAVRGYGICWTVRRIAAAYRDRDGHAEHWGKSTARLDEMDRM
jgi:hypothetical protein